LIINTEDPDASDYGEEQEPSERQELIKIKQQIDSENDPYMKEQLLQLYSQPLKMMGLKSPDMIEAEAFFENTDDIINEEEYEESIIN
jgi:hypothetical protein